MVTAGDVSGDDPPLSRSFAAVGLPGSAYRQGCPDCVSADGFCWRLGTDREPIEIAVVIFVQISIA
jgi:hypothetical protein